MQQLRFTLIGLASVIPAIVATVLLSSQPPLSIALYAIAATLFGLAAYGLFFRYVRRSARADWRTTPTDRQRGALRIVPVIFGLLGVLFLFQGATVSTTSLSIPYYAASAISIATGSYYGVALMALWYRESTGRAKRAARESETPTRAAVTGGVITVTGMILFTLLAVLAGPVALGFVAEGVAVVMAGLAIFFEACYLRGQDPYRRLRLRAPATPP